MWNDFKLTNIVHNATLDTQSLLQEVFAEMTIPRTPMCHEFRLPESTTWWIANLPKFPRSHRKSGAVFLVDRIPRLPQKAREALIRLYFDDSKEMQEEHMNNEENEHCLVRVYLGERETEAQQEDWYDSLRNFPLRLNMIEDLDLDHFSIASEMAIGLSIVHWQAQVDGMDMEFVFGSSATNREMEARGYVPHTPPREIQQAHRLHVAKRRLTHLWMLDFDEASKIQLTDSDVDLKLVPAFLGNDPYYPRPDVDQEL